MILYQNHIGCDISKAHLDFSNTATDKCVRIANDSQAIEAYLAGINPDGSLVIFEATGHYDRCLRHALHDAGMACVRVNPAQARNFARAIGKRAKTDALDARALATMGKALELQADGVPDKHRERLTCLAKRRDQLVAMGSAEKVRLTDAANDPLISATIKQTLALFAAQINELEHEIADLVEASATLSRQHALLRSVPGIGPVAAITLISLMPELGNTGPKQIGALAGLVPFNHDSGKMKGQRRISGGRKRVRKALYMAALSAIRCNSRYRGIYENILKRNKAKKIAIIAVARRMLVHCNAIIRDQKQWA